jgi:3-methyladenine DNA glycosylase AlkC
MADQLKNIYSKSFIKDFTNVLAKVAPDLNKRQFVRQIFDAEWENKELKQRMRHIALVLSDHLNGSYSENVDVILRLIKELEWAGMREYSLEFMFLPDYIEVNGMEYPEISLAAMEIITSYTSCEFAIRPFLILYPDLTMKRMHSWSRHRNVHVRRLASEGCRPRLPWAMAIPALKDDPSVILPILENLKDDEFEYVRRSVANNLNDISKDNPEVTLRTAKKWKGMNMSTDRLIKHACRTLLKEGNLEAMKLFGFAPLDFVKIKQFELLTPKVKIGEDLEFSFELLNSNQDSTLVRLEYGLYYQKANGSLSKKVFKISEKSYAELSSTRINRKQPFKLISTRRFHEGPHQLSLIINGIESEKLDFELVS